MTGAKKKTLTSLDEAPAYLMDRRRFLKNMGLLAAGSALGSLFGCGSDFAIPCLGPAPPPTPVPGMTYIRASEIGCALDCNLNNGRHKHTGGLATDDAPLINAAMAGATADRPITLIIDGSALISGLYLPAGGHWGIAGLGCGTGFFVKSGANSDGIHNGPPDADVPFDPNGPAPPRGMNVSLSNFTLNGNQGNGFDGDSTTGTRLGSNLALYCGINLMNLDHISIEKVVLVNTPAFHIRLSNVGHVNASGCVMKSHGVGTDGLHFDGPSNDIKISDCNFTTNDDSIALNCPEGYGGDISRVVVNNCKFNSWSLMRLYTTYGSRKFRIDDVTVSNCSGKLAEAAFLIGLINGSNLNSVASLTVSDCWLTAPTILAIAENFGTIILKNVTHVPSLSGVVWVPPVPDHVCGFLRSSPLYGSVTFVGSSLQFENCAVFRTDDTDCAAVVLENGSRIANVALNGLVMQGTYSPAPVLLDLGGGSIANLVLDSVDSTSFKSPVSPVEFSKIGLISGAKVLATGWEFPDAVMADEVPYVSANSGMPSIKINGVVELIPNPD